MDWCGKSTGCWEASGVKKFTGFPLNSAGRLFRSVQTLQKDAAGARTLKWDDSCESQWDPPASWITTSCFAKILDSYATKTTSERQEASLRSAKCSGDCWTASKVNWSTRAKLLLRAKG